MGARNAINVFVHTWNRITVHFRTRLPTSSGVFFETSQQTRCTEKLVIHLYDKNWNVHTTELDIAEERNLHPDVTSTYEIKLDVSLSFHPQSHVKISRPGIWKHELRMPKSTHVVIDFPHCWEYECYRFRDTWSNKFACVCVSSLKVN